MGLPRRSNAPFGGIAAAGPTVDSSSAAPGPGSQSGYVAAKLSSDFSILPCRLRSPCAAAAAAMHVRVRVRAGGDAAVAL